MNDLPIQTNARADGIRRLLGRRAIVFVGLMGAGKTAIGRIVARDLGLRFADSDHEIEAASRMTIPELFELYGEPEFRALEQRVILRLIDEGPIVVSTGGGAFMNAETRRMIGENGMSVWLKADLDTLMERVAKKQNRPLLKTADPRRTMRDLIDARYPVYAAADIVVTSRNEPREMIAAEVIAAIADHLRLPPEPDDSNDPS